MDEDPGVAETRTEGHVRVKNIVHIVESFWEAVEDRSLKINTVSIDPVFLASAVHLHRN